jgi:DNA-damage-inducible protein J
MKTLQIRVPDGLREAADEVLNEIGLDMPTAIRIYLNKITQTRSIPFSLEASPLLIEDISIDSDTQEKIDAIGETWGKMKK